MDDKHLLIVKDKQGQRKHALNVQIYSIGRSSACDIQLICPFVSRHHAMLIPLPINYYKYHYCIVDGDLEGGSKSRNGLLVNGRKVNVHPLQDEDKIVFGTQATAVYYCLHSHGDRSQIAMAGEDFPTAWLDRYQKMSSLLEDDLNL